MCKCLVIGGTGFLGTNLCEALVIAGYEVSALARGGEKAERLKRILPSVQFIEADFMTIKNWDMYLDNIDIVFHLVSTTKPSNKDLLYEFSSNVMPTIRFLEACIDKRLKVIYFSSGGTVYGVPRYLPIDEYHRTEPISAYGIHKLSVEKCIEYYGRTYGIHYNILRIANPYGEYQDVNGNQGIIGVFLNKLRNRETLEIWGNGEAIRDYIYVKDLMSACMKLITYNGSEKIFNIGSGKGYAVKEVVQIIKQHFSHRVEIKFLPARIQDVSANILDISVATRELKWEPSVMLEDGICIMIGCQDI